MAKSSQGMDVGKMAFDSFGKVMDSMDLVKRSWSGFSVPSAFTPTLDVEELDKRIADLRAVEQWLTLNQNMLRTTIQGLEIQRGTLDAMRAMSASFGKGLEPGDDSLAQTLAGFAAAAARKSVTPPAEGAADAPDAGAAARSAPAPGMPGTLFDWSPFAVPSAFGAAAQARAPAGTAPESAADSGADSGADSEAESPADPARDEVPGTAAAADPGNLQAGPLAWWNMLQENFRQIAQAATASAGAAAGDASAPAGGPAAGKPSGKSTSGKSTSGKSAPGKSTPRKGSSAKAARAGSKAGATGKTRAAGGKGGSSAATRRAKPRGTAEQS